MVIPPKNFDLNNLESLWSDTGKIDKSKQTKVYEPILISDPLKKHSGIQLKLTESVVFSMTEFCKTNKGLVNSSINCFMNVVLQSLVACPAFFNMLCSVSQSQESYSKIIEHRPTLRKFVELSRYFDPEVLNSESSESIYNHRVVNA